MPNSDIPSFVFGNMKGKSSERARIFNFWRSFLGAFLIFIIFWIILSLGTDPDTDQFRFYFSESFSTLGFIAILACCFFAAKWMDGQRERYRNLTAQEFVDNINKGILKDLEVDNSK